MLEKPTFPKPRTIREDFLPEPMKKYRIKKETYGGNTRYFPEERNMWTLWRWNRVFAFEIYFDGGFDTLEEARKRLCEYCREPVVEYLDFDPNKDCK